MFSKYIGNLKTKIKKKSHYFHFDICFFTNFAINDFFVFISLFCFQSFDLPIFFDLVLVCFCKNMVFLSVVL